VGANGAVNELVTQTDGVASDMRLTALNIWKSGSSIEGGKLARALLDLEWSFLGS
jgi:hypothetical protein